MHNLENKNNKFWGDPSVLSMDKLDIVWKKKFNDLLQRALPRYLMMN